MKERVLVTGCFDLLHAGHVHFLSEVYRQYVGEKKELHVGICSDSDCFYLKKRYPIYPLEHRVRLVEALQVVEKVHTFELWRDAPAGMLDVQDGHRDLIETVKPSLFVDSRQKPREHIGSLPYLIGIDIAYVDSVDIHTTDILDAIRERGD